MPNGQRGIAQTFRQLFRAADGLNPPTSVGIHRNPYVEE